MLFDDKNLVIIAVTLICLVSMFVVTAPENIIIAVLSGLFGLVSGAVLTPHINDKKEKVIYPLSMKILKFLD